MSFAHVKWQGWCALVIMSVQNGLAILLMRYSKVNGDAYDSQVAVLMQECAIKLPICGLLYAIEVGGPLSMVSKIVADLRERPLEWAQLAVPALLYTVQNTCLYIGFANIEAAVGQVTYQSKILWTALFSVLILGKRLSPNQWLALGLLAAGVLTVQWSGESSSGSGSASPPPPELATVKEHQHGGKHQHSDHTQRGLVEAQRAAGNPLVGLGALILAAVCTSFAGVYFEKMLKGASKPSLWLRNIQLAIYCSAIAIVGILAKGDPKLKETGWLAGFGPLTWFCVAFQAAGGLIVAVTIKYADNIMKSFAQGIAIIIGAIGSYLLFSFHISATFCGGVGLVIGAIFLYGGKAQTPQELCESLCGTCCGSRAVEPAEDGAMLVGAEEADDAEGRAPLGQSLSGDESVPSPKATAAPLSKTPPQ